MNRFLNVGSACFLILPILFTSCASIFNGSTQQVKLSTRTQNATVYLNGDKAGQGRYANLTLKRDKIPKQVRVTADGYKPYYTVMVQTKRPWLYYLSIFPFGVLLYPPFYDKGPKAYDYKDRYTVKPKTQFTDRKEDEKFLFLDNLNFNVKKEDFQFQYYSDYDDFKKETDADKNLKLEEDMDFTAEDGEDVMNVILNSHNYIDTSNNVFRDKTNTVNIDAEIQEVDFDICFPHDFVGDDKERVNVLKARVKVNLRLESIYGEKLYEESLRSQSGIFTTADGYEDAFGSTTRDAIYQAMAKFLRRDQVREKLKKEEYKTPEYSQLTLELGEAIEGLNDAQQASVTVMSGDDGHGSGCVIGRNGYIVTNYHVVATNKDNLKVRLNNSQKVKAELKRKNVYSDLALLKVDKQFNKTFTIPTEKSYKTGMTVYAIGTPESVQLGQTLTKGIISGVRKHKENTYLQSDVSVNPGSSGGSLVNEKGYLVGVVSSKIMGYANEGISFSFPAHLIDDRLGIRYETD
jgi:serine protease Do